MVSIRCNIKAWRYGTDLGDVRTSLPCTRMHSCCLTIWRLCMVRRWRLSRGTYCQWKAVKVKCQSWLEVILHAEVDVRGMTVCRKYVFGECSSYRGVFGVCIDDFLKYFLRSRDKLWKLSQAGDKFWEIIPRLG